MRGKNLVTEYFHGNNIDVRVDFIWFWDILLSVVISGAIRMLAYIGTNQTPDVAVEPKALSSSGQAFLL